MRKATFKAGTARETAERGEGFSANGESQWTRNAAQPGNVKLNHYGLEEPKPWRPDGAKLRQREERMARAADIEFNEVEIAKMVARVQTETNPERRAKLRKNIGIKRRFVERLKSELDDDGTAKD
jgi:hypothetical protein